METYWKANHRKFVERSLEAEIAIKTIIKYAHDGDRYDSIKPVKIWSNTDENVN